MATFAMVCVACLSCVGTPALAQQFPVTERILKNGMKVLVQSDHSIPNVALYIFYRIGSRNERPGTTGISHFFEHMMFNGAKKYGPGELDKVMEANGGSNVIAQDFADCAVDALIAECPRDVSDSVVAPARRQPSSTAG